MMKKELFDFGFIEYVRENILVVVVKFGVVIDKNIANNLITIIKEKTDRESILIVDRQNEYSYTAEAMMALNDKNLSTIIATGIIVYSKESKIVTEDQVEAMAYFGRTNLNIFPSFDLALNWAEDYLVK